MDGKINKDGFLCIKRRGKYRVQVCPFSAVSTGGSYTSRSVVSCGDHCALFGEVEINESIDVGDSYNENYSLELCHKTLSFGEFESVYEEKI